MIKILAFLLLAAFLIFLGLEALFGLHFEAEPTVQGLLALGAGVLLLFSLGMDWQNRST